MKHCFNGVAKSGFFLLCLGLSACGTESVDKSPQSIEQTEYDSTETDHSPESTLSGSAESDNVANNAEAGDAADSQVLSSQPDSANTIIGQDITIDILANDFGLGDGEVNIVILSPPSHGSTLLNTDNTVTYIPNGVFVGEDNFAYQVTNVGGTSSISNVAVTIDCTASCSSAIARNVRLSWEANTEVDIEGYYVYFGTESGNYSETVWVGNKTQHDYTTNALGTLYFAVSALNTQGAESDFSREVAFNN